MIRTATELDGLEALRLGHKYVEESDPLQSESFCAETAIHNFLLSMSDPRHLVLIAYDEQGIAVGLLWAVCAPVNPWSAALIALPFILYVDPDYRKGSYGLKLIRQYEEWAESMGADEIQLSVASGIHPEKTGRLYQKLGYTCYGQAYKRST